MCVICLLLIICMNSFAAVVSDNDGTAFITKAEFDSLKNSFQTELDEYNSRIDNKMDDAISGYLSGVKASKLTEIKPIVSNYADIMWQPNYKVYGQWIKWTNNTSKTQSSSNVWFAPSLAEKRWTWRGTDWWLWDNMEHAFGSITACYHVSGTEMSGGLSVNNGYGSGSAGYSQSCPTLTIQLSENKTDNVWYVPNAISALTNMYCTTRDTYSDAHPVYPDSGGLYIFSFTSDSAELTSAPTILTPGSGEYFKHRFTIKNSAGTTGTYTSAMNRNNTVFPWVWRTASAFAGPNMSDFTNATATTDPNFIKSDYFSTGCTFHKLDNSSTIKQYTLLHNMMLGSNYDQNVNVAKYKGSRSEGYSYDMSESTQYATFKGTYDRSVVSSLGWFSNSISATLANILN